MSNPILDVDDEMADVPEVTTASAPASASSSTQVPHQMGAEGITSYPPTASVQSQMNVNALTTGTDSHSAQGPHRMNVARHLFNFFNQPPRPVPATMPQGDPAQNESSGAQQSTAASNTYRPYFPRATTQPNRHLESQSLPRRAISRVEPASMQPVPPASNVCRREREPSAASRESPPLEEQVVTERVTKVQLVEKESLQVTEQLARQAAAIEQLKQQLAERDARLDREAEEARRIRAEAYLRVQQAEQRAQHMIQEVLQRVTAQQDARFNRMMEEEVPGVNASPEAQLQEAEQHIHEIREKTRENHQEPQSQNPRGNMSPGPRVAIDSQSNIKSPIPLELRTQQEANIPIDPVEGTGDREILNTSNPMPSRFEDTGAPTSEHPHNMGSDEVGGIDIDMDGQGSAAGMDGHNGAADSEPSSDEVEEMFTTDNGRYKARVSEGLDSSDEEETGRKFGKEGSIPPPINFSRPKGGAGPTLRFSQASNIRNRPMQGLEGTPQPRLMTVEEKLDLVVESLQGMERRLEHLKDHPTDMPSKRMRQHPGPFKPPPKREHSPGRTDMLAKVRKEMNYLLGIQVDKDVLKGGLTPPQEALDLWDDDEQGEGPALKPMKPDWSNLRSSWNSQLEELFCAHFCNKWDIDDEDMESGVCDMFRQRLERLRRLIKRDLPRAGEMPDQAAARAKKTTAAALARQRPNSRRRELYFSRLDTTLANRETPGGDIDPAWDKLHDIVAALGQAGMSSDESDCENPERPMYVAKKRDWRNKGLIPYLAAVDRDRNTTNAYGNTRAGNPPRYRPRKRGKRSVRLAIPGLPINFYDAGWLAGLSNGEMRSLRPGRAMALPDFEED